MFFHLSASFLEILDCDDIWYLAITLHEFNLGLHKSGIVIKCDKTKGKGNIKPVCVLGYNNHVNRVDFKISSL
jgi:hypothetical protein